jgi:hypothetical protein
MPIDRSNVVSTHRSGAYACSGLVLRVARAKHDTLVALRAQVEVSGLDVLADGSTS